MSMELYYLVLFALLIVATILIQQLASVFSEGLLPLFGSREDVKFKGITGRLERAIINSVIAMSIMAPTVLALHLTNTSTSGTVLAMQIFLISRLLYILSYAFSIFGLRSGAWVSGLLCNLWLFFVLI